jgi:hypothetical protein
MELSTGQRHPHGGCRGVYQSQNDIEKDWFRLACIGAAISLRPFGSSFILFRLVAFGRINNED